MAEKTVMDQALKLLSRQAYSATKLSEKLKRSGYSAEEIMDCLKRLEGWGYLNDRNYGINRIEAMKAKLKSRYYVENNLIESGLNQILVKELLEENYPESLEYSIAKKFLLSKNSTNKVKKHPQWMVLARAGFSEETIRKCFPDRDFDYI